MSNTSHDSSSSAQQLQGGENEDGNDANSSGEIKQQHKRPFSLNLSGISSHTSPENQEKKTTEEEKEQINDYANQMASKLVVDAIEEDPKDEDKE